MFRKLLAKYQKMILNMFLNGLLTENEFNMLAILSENIEKDLDALEIVLIIQPSDMEDRDLIDCILAKQFKTAGMILSES